MQVTGNDEQQIITIHDRAGVHDAANTFPDDDLADLREAGYLGAFVPEAFGGAGLTLEQIAAEEAPPDSLLLAWQCLLLDLGRPAA